MINLAKFFRNTLLALGQSYDCPSANKGTLKNMNPKSTDNTATTKQNKIKQYNTKPHAYFVGCSVFQRLKCSQVSNKHWITKMHHKKEHPWQIESFFTPNICELTIRFTVISGYETVHPLKIANSWMGDLKLVSVTDADDDLVLKHQVISI